MITKIGIWEIDDDGITGKVNPTYDYHIGSGRLWETQDFHGYPVWSWLIHLTEKDWITKENINDLNIAFIFGQNLFKSQRPNLKSNPSLAQTLYIQQQLMDIRVTMDREFPEDEIGTSLFSDESAKSMTRYGQLLNQIKFLPNL